MRKTNLLIIILAILCSSLCTSGLLVSSDLSDDKTAVEGIWQGALKVSGIELRLVFTIQKEDDGTKTATMDSPDQGATGIPVSGVIVNNDSLILEVNAVKGNFKGLILDEENITGNWNQSGMTFPLELKRVDKVDEIKRPQTPEKPYPYREEEVEYKNKRDGNVLAGTLTTPETGGPFPAVLLITGSGAQDRDETIFNHKPFLVLADYLTRLGIAVLRVDDRGVGGSSGDISKATSKDFANDVLAGVEFLKTRNEIDKNKIGLMGHSEGGMIAPMAASQSDDITFIVLLAGTGLTGEEILYMQAALIAKANGVNDTLIHKNKIQQERLFTVIKKIKDDSLACKKLVKILHESIVDYNDKEKKALEIDEKNIEQQAKVLVSPWIRYFLTYDPRPVLKKVKCPVLAIIGEKDLQVPPKENLIEIEKALKEGGNRHYVVKEIPGLNHLFQTAETGSPAEYGKIEETFSPVALKIIGDWLLEQVGK